MKEQAAKFSSIDLNDARIKFTLYVNKIINQSNTHTIQQKTCNLAAQNFIKFGENQQYSKKNYELLRELIFQKRSYYLLYIVDILLKNNRHVLAMAKRDLQNMFKVVWQRVNTEQKKQIKLQHMKAIAKTWIVIYQKKLDIQQSLKKWLDQKYNTNLNLSQRNQALFQQNYQKSKDGDIKLQQLLTQLSKEQPARTSTTSLLELRNKIFQD